MQSLTHGAETNPLTQTPNPSRGTPIHDKTTGQLIYSTCVTDTLRNAWVWESGSSISPALTNAARVKPRSWPSLRREIAVDANLKNQSTLLPDAASARRSAVAAPALLPLVRNRTAPPPPVLLLPTVKWVVFVMLVVPYNTCKNCNGVNVNMKRWLIHVNVCATCLSGLVCPRGGEK